MSLIHFKKLIFAASIPSFIILPTRTLMPLVNLYASIKGVLRCTFFKKRYCRGLSALLIFTKYEPLATFVQPTS